MHRPSGEQIANCSFSGVLVWLRSPRNNSNNVANVNTNGNANSNNYNNAYGVRPDLPLPWRRFASWRK